MTEQLNKRIDHLVREHKVILFMKGEKGAPQCTFSSVADAILQHLGTDYETYNVLEDPEMREGIKEYSQWPTVPQLYINGEFVGGSDIMQELFQNGELQKLLQ